MLVTRTSDISGEVNSLDLPITEDQRLRFEAGIEPIQNIFPNLSAEEREFIMTGITPAEWEEIFKEEEDI